MSTRRFFVILALFFFASISCAHEEGIVHYRDTLSPAAQVRHDQEIDTLLSWVFGMTEYFKLGYTKPDKRPEIYIVSRAYIIRHEAQICFFTSIPEEMRSCALHVFGWTDDDRHLYILRAEDVVVTEDFPGSVMVNFPMELWVKMVRAHEAVHYIQSEGSPYRLSKLPCAIEEKWESEAFRIAEQWLHAQQSVDAERINTLFRGQFRHFGCIPPSDEFPQLTLTPKG